MKFTLNWLKEYLETTASLDEITAKLTTLGLEVESVTDLSKNLKEFRIAQILEAVPHPNADKLRVCKVNTGSEQLQIVCGAANARAGINVVLAPVGSIIPTNGLQIRASQIRGVESNGMLCSAEELGLESDSDGIIEMPASNDNLAKNFAEFAGLSDPIIEIAITPNRGDCLGVYGIARDLAASGLGKLKSLPEVKIAGKFESPVNVKIADEAACPMFVGRYFKNVKNTASPEWLQNRLKAVGLKPISALVDITNYISFEFGRPLHVYDAKKLSGNLTARFAKDGEKITALNDIEYSLKNSMLVIADDKSPQALAGVIGGKDSGCADSTTDVFLEVALFNPFEVTKTGRTLEIITDSRYRFERNVDPAFVLKGAEIASKMILDLCGGEASNLVVAGKEPSTQKTIEFDFRKLSSLGGVDLSEDAARKILTSLGFTITGKKISTPSWRPDIEGEADLVEEILRINGYDKIPTHSLPESTNNFESVLTQKQNRVFKIRRLLTARGLSEAITWSFMSSKTAKLFGSIKENLRLKNPISSDLDVMRPSILPNLIDAVKRNSDRGFSDLALFESGLIFENTTADGQLPVVAGIRSGKFVPKNIYGTMRNVDLFDAKADCLEALAIAGAPVSNLKITTDAPSYYHPGRSGVLRLGKATLGIFGEIHPKILKEMDVKLPVSGFEIFINNIPQSKKKSSAKPKMEISEYQASTRDFAFIVDKNLQAEEIIQAVKNVDKILIKEANIFDIYQGKGIDEGKKSLAFSIIIQAKDKTLTDVELEEISKKVIDSVQKLGGVLRG